MAPWTGESTNVCGRAIQPTCNSNNNNNSNNTNGNHKSANTNNNNNGSNNNINNSNNKSNNNNGNINSNSNKVSRDKLDRAPDAPLDWLAPTDHAHYYDGTEPRR